MFKETNNEMNINLLINYSISSHDLLPQKKEYYWITTHMNVIEQWAKEGWEEKQPYKLKMSLRERRTEEEWKY